MKTNIVPKQFESHHGTISGNSCHSCRFRTLVDGYRSGCIQRHLKLIISEFIYSPTNKIQEFYSVKTYFIQELLCLTSEGHK